jgi:hypothetical protein
MEECLKSGYSRLGHDIDELKPIGAAWAHESESFSTCDQVLDVSTHNLGTPSLAQSSSWRSAEQIENVFACT